MSSPQKTPAVETSMSLRTWALLGLLSLMWGCSFPFVKVALGGGRPSFTTNDGRFSARIRGVMLMALSNKFGVSLDPASRGPHASKTMSFLAMDDPGHLRLRTLVSKGFTPRRIRELEPNVHSAASLIQVRIDVGDLSPKYFAWESGQSHDDPLAFVNIRDLVFVDFDLTPHLGVVGNGIYVGLRRHVHVLEGVLLNHVSGHR